MYIGGWVVILNVIHCLTTNGCVNESFRQIKGTAIDLPTFLSIVLHEYYTNTHKGSMRVLYPITKLEYIIHVCFDTDEWFW